MKIKELTIQASDIFVRGSRDKRRMYLRHDGKEYGHAGNTNEKDIRKYLKEDTGFEVKLALVTNPFYIKRDGTVVPIEDEGSRAVWVWSG